MIRALDGDMHGRLLPRHEVKGDTEENRIYGAAELQRCEEMGVKANVVLKWKTWRAATTSSSQQQALQR